MVTYWSWNTVFLYYSSAIITLIIAKLSMKCNIHNKYKRELIRDHNKANSLILLLSFIPILLLQVCRDSTIGGDLVNYLPQYQSMKYNTYSLKSIVENIPSEEPLFVISNLIIGTLSNWDNQVYISFYSIIPILFTYLAIRKESKDYGVIIPIIVYIGINYFRSFSMLRQCIAMSIILYAYTFIKENNKSIYFTLTALALGYHYTAIIALPIYFFSSNSSKLEEISKLKKIVTISLFIIFIILGDKILNVLLSGLDTRYSTLGNQREAFGLGNLLIRLPLLIIILYFSKSMKKYRPEVNIYLQIYYLDIIIAQMRYINPMFGRLNIYTIMPLIFIVPVLDKVIEKKFPYIGRYIVWIVLILYILFQLYHYVFVNPYYIMPYKTFWS